MAMLRAICVGRQLVLSSDGESLSPAHAAIEFLRGSSATGAVGAFIKAGLHAASDRALTECIDHIEISVASMEAGIDSRNFVLCPGNVYDARPVGPHERKTGVPCGGWCARGK